MNLDQICLNCKFYSGNGCGANPYYWEAFRAIAQLERDQKKAIEPIITDCKDWQAEPVKTHEITLPEREWRAIADLRISNNSELRELIRAVRKILDRELDDAMGYDDIPF